MLNKTFNLILAAFCMLVSTNLFAQDCTLSCSTSIIDISLDENCEHTVELADVLSSSLDCQGPLIVDLFDELDFPIVTSPVINGDYIGRQITARITDQYSGNQCEVPLAILDKQIPQLNCGDVEYSCEVGVPMPEIPVTVSRNINETYEDECQEITLNIDGFIGTLKDLNIYIDLSLEDAVDGSIRLTSPDGANIELINLSEISACSNSNLKVNLDAEAQGSLQTLDAICIPDGTHNGRYKAAGNLVDFVGELINGTWTVEICVADENKVTINIISLSVSDDQVIFPLPIGGNISISEIDQNTFSLNGFDGCGSATLSYFDIEENLDCASRFNKEITRTWNVIDEYGNSNICSEKISFGRKSPDQISLPDDRSEDNGNALSCELQMPSGTGNQPNIGWNALPNGHPSPDDVYYDSPYENVVKWYGTGRPEVGGCYDLNFTFSDIKINQCSEEGNTNCFKINRTWLANDPCTNEPFEFVQQIFVVDKIGPDISNIENAIITTEGFSCEADWVVPIPTITDNCATEASISYSVFTEEGYITYNSFSNQYTIRELPVGIHELTITASDCCGNETNENLTLEVRDQILPSVTCESYLTTNLGQDGVSKVFAQTFDEGSLDGCGPVFFKVIRMEDLKETLEGVIEDQTTESCNGNNGDDDPELIGNQIFFDDHVKFCCSDLGNQVQVVLRVFDVNPGTGPIHPNRMKIGGDLYNRFNDCMPLVSVNDKQSPNIFCPDDITINCNQWYQDTSLTGVPVAYDNCSLTSVSFEDEVNLNQCQVGTITRTWTAVDHTGRTASCDQLITMQDTTDPIIVYPADRTIDCADLDDLNIAGQPIVDDNCALIGWNYSDQVFPIGGSCKLKVIRTWSGMDLCDWVAYSDIQTIIAEDNLPPILLNIPEDLTVECDDIPSPANVEATDDCDNASTITLQENILDQNCPHGYILERIWTATDVCGNMVSGGHQITIEDNLAPVFDSIPQDMNLSCAAQAPLIPVTAQDNCDLDPIVEFNESIVPGDCPNRFTLVRTWTTTDACGNESQISQNLNFSDDEAPILMNVPLDVTINCGEAIPNPPTVTVSDNCENDLVPVLMSESGPDYCDDGILLTRTWSATDACGNSTSEVQLIFLFDNDPPVFDELPTDITISCTDDLPDSKLTATDLCTPEIVVDFNMGIQFIGCAQNQLITRTWTAEDDCGNVATHSMTITVSDDEAPFIEENIENITISCDQSIPTSDVTVRDNCDGNPSIDFSELTIPGACPNESVIERSWLLTDACGNTQTINQSISIVDEIVPVFNNTPVDITVECDAIPDPLSLLATDNCDGSITPLLTETRTDGSCIDSYTLLRTWVASDACGNENTVSQNIFVEDNSSPIITAGPAQIFASCDNIPAPPTAVATDNCDMSLTISFSERQIDSTCLDLFRIERTWTTFDNCGNQGTFVQNVIVSDDVAPILLGVPANLTVACDAIPDAALVTATDNCDPSISVEFEEEFNAGLCEAQGILTRTWTAIDRCGNMVSQEQLINVGNSILPIFSGVPNDITVSCNAIPPPAMPSAEGACGTMTTISFQENRTEIECDFDIEIERIWIAIDDCGNESSATQNIRVTDLIDPVFSNLPANITISCSESIPFDEPTVSDNCSNDLEINFSEEETDGDCIGEAIISRTWDVEDECGNFVEYTQMITIQDNDAPLITNVPANITISCDDLDTDFGTPDILDVCDEEASLELEELEEFVCPGTFTITRTWTAVDDCGNSSSASQIVSVIDNIAPELSSEPQDVTVNCDQIPIIPIITATDNCDNDPSSTFSEDIIPGNCLGNYQIKRTWRSIDHCNNETVHVQTITVTDLVDPTFINFPADFEVSCANDPLISGVIIETNDNCDPDVGISINQSVTDSICINQFTIVREYVITDDCGNSISQVLTITVNDDVAPEFPQIQSDISVSCENIPDPSLIIATDNCLGPIDLDYSQNIVDSVCVGNLTLLRKWIATDACGNVDSLEQTIRVFDDTPPVFVPDSLPNYEISCNDPIPPVPVVTATDNCGLMGELDFFDDIVDENDDCPEFTYSIRRTWIVRDQCSNSADIVQVIAIADLEAPTFISAIEDVTVECDEIPTTDAILFEDNCDLEPIISSTDIRIDGNCQNEFVLNRTITISDACGNSRDAIQQITVFDETAPTITCPDSIEVVINNEIDPAGGPLVCELEVEVPLPQVFDNCDGSPEISNNSIYSFSNNGAATGLYPIGVTEITYYATDDCGNQDSCNVVITVLDEVAPAIICPGITQVSINPFNSLAFIFMENYMPFAEDCQPFVRYFEPDSVDFLVFDCDDVGMEFNIIATAEDISGNQNGCTSTVTITDPMNVCPTSGSGINGTIATEDLTPINNVNILVNEQPVVSTNEAGDYLVEEVVIGSDYSIRPSFNLLERQTITTLDLVLLSRHLIGLQPLDSPYKMIAADVDYSGNIDIFDLIELQKLIIFNIDEFSEGNAWRFVDKNYNFLNEEAPLDESFPEQLDIENYQGDLVYQNFIGVQLGNLNSQLETNENVSEKSLWNWKIPSIDIHPSTEVILPVFAESLIGFDGLQIEWSFNSKKIDILNIIPGQLDPVFNVRRNKLLMSSISNAPKIIEANEPLFTILLKSSENCKTDALFTASGEFLNSYAVANNNISHSIQLGIEHLESNSVKPTKDLPVLFSNRPNPFTEQTTLRFNLPTEEDLTIQIVDVAGQALYRQNMFLKAGYQEIVIKRDQLDAVGVLFCQLITTKGTVTQKLLLLDQ